MFFIETIRRRIVHALGAKDRAQAQANWMRAYREQQRIKATYDAARTPDDLKNYWANADSFDADSAHSKAVRDILVRRSRYELANNGFSDGMTQTYATDLCGTGPKLRMTTSSSGYNQLVEFWWEEWCKAVGFRRKLWCMAHAKDGDGEAISVLRRNPGVNHPVKLDIVQYETEQCQTPMLTWGEAGHIDGIEFDKYGNPTFYDILTQHPGSSQNGTLPMTMIPEQVPAQYVLHWFKLRRPRQHRGVPERASTLNLGAVFRRGREATLSTWEKVASWTFFLKGMFEPLEDDKDPAVPLSTMDITHNMMTQLPNTVEPWQPEVKHPGPNYEAFHKLTLNEQARPKSMPLNKAQCNSADYNYASGRLDHATYYGELDFERSDCDELVLDKMFAIWYDLAVAVFGWLGGDPEAISAKARSHTWDWPKHKVADIEAQANADGKRLQTGQVFITRLYSDNGYDFEDDVAEFAAVMGKDVQEVKDRIFDVLFPEKPQPGDSLPSLADRNQEAKDRQKQKAAASADDAEFGLIELHADIELHDIEASWVTLDNGVAIEIDDSTGTVVKGPKGMVGKPAEKAHKAARLSKEARDKTQRAMPHGSNPTSEHHQESAKRFREAQTAHKEASNAYREIDDKGTASLHEYSAKQSQKAAVLHEKLAKLHRAKEQGRPAPKVKFESRFDLNHSNGNGAHSHAN